MKTNDFLSVGDLTADELQALIVLAGEMKDTPERFRGSLAGKCQALLFEKPSLRTRTTAEVAMYRLSGHSIYLAPSDVGLGKRESVADIARNLERWVDAVTARTFAHATVVELARWSRVPVINALTDLLHPCQALADFMTLLEHMGDVRGKRLCYVGDGNNVAHSLLLGAPRVGLDITVLTPPGFEPAAEIVEQARAAAAAEAGSSVITATDLDAVDGADAVYTDVWASMGQEAEAEERARVFLPYQVNAALMARAKPGALFLHCLPAHRGDEVTDEVADGPGSVIFDEAENRLWAHMAILHGLLART
jgi:ornithine carbamoyltransferase